MAMAPHFFNKREPESAPVRHVVPTPGTTTLGSSSSSSSTSDNVLASASVAASPSGASATTAASGSKLTVGPNIKLKGVEITDCDTLVVEGFVEATMDSRVMQISEQGSFKGSAEIDIAEIHGQFDGNLTVRQKLIIYATGKVTGKVCYGKLVIEEGGQLSGDIHYGAMPIHKSSSSDKHALALAG